MECFFNPRNVAIVGATPTPGKGGYNIVYNIKKGFTGGIFPVNPNYGEIMGMVCYPSVDDIPEPIDLVIVFVPAAIVPEVIAACGRKGVEGVIIQSAGFAETGENGSRLQEQVMSLAKQHGIRIWGPNCVGLVDIGRRQVFSFIAPGILKPQVIAGGVSMIVQSGMLSGGFLMDMMMADRMGFAKVCSIGNKMDVNECDLLAYLLNDPQTRVVGCYLENLVDGRRLIELCRRTEKPVVILKGGQSEHGARAAQSHTASMAADRAVVRGILARAGVIEARDFKQMADICNTLALIPAPSNGEEGRVAVLTYSGGAGIVSTDLMEGRHMRLAELSSDTIAKIQPVFPDWMPVGNPVDFWPAVEKSGPLKTYTTCLQAVLEDPGVDAVLLHMFLGGRMNLDVSSLARAAEKAGKPLFCWAIGHDEVRRELTDVFREHGVPVFRELERTAECMDALFAKQKPARPRIQAGEAAEKSVIPEDLSQRFPDAGGVMDEYEARQILRRLNMPVVEESLARSPEKAVEAADQLGYPVVLKGIAPERIHKTEAGLVRLDLRTAAEVRFAAHSLTDAMGERGRLLVQRQVSGRLELMAGLIRDKQFGPCVMIGLGGVLAEIMGDVAFSPAPLTGADALALIDRLQSQQLLNGFRGEPAADRSALAHILVCLGDLGNCFEALQEIDLNPLIISDGQPVVADAAVILKTGTS